jgi:hypothetical protein
VEDENGCAPKTKLSRAPKSRRKRKEKRKEEKFIFVKL